MPAPTIRVFVDFDSDTAFETDPLILGSATEGILGTNRLGSGTLPVEITDLVTRVGIRRGRNRITSKFEFGSADVVLYDQNGDWNPTNSAGAYYPNLVPLRQIIIYATYLGVDYYIFSGYITNYDTGFRQGNEDVSTVTLRCVDAFKLLAGSAITTVAILLPVPVIGQGSVNVLAVQGNVPKLGLDFNSRAQEVFNYHLKQTDIALRAIQSKPDVIIWPENSVDIDPFMNPQIGKKISDLAKQIEVPVIVGAVLKGTEGPENASVMWNSDGLVSSKYVKRSLTPFGEYIPLRKLASAVSPFAEGVVDFVPGNEIILHQVGRAAIAPIICYEIINDSAVHSISKNSNLLILQTNNATFADSGQSAQQLNITRIRAVENNRWVVSISTTGVSAIIDNSGGIQQITKQNSASFLSGDVQLSSGTSLAYKIGNWTAFVCILLSIAIYLGKRRRDA